MYDSEHDTRVIRFATYAALCVRDASDGDDWVGP
jgi:hypothetical protein